MRRGLGTQLRHLTELLDGAVSRAYEQDGLSHRPRYFPVMRALVEQSPLSVTQIANKSGITQPAATQTIALMIREGILISNQDADDSRQKLIEMTPYARSLLPRLQDCWGAVTQAANRLDSELPFPLSQILDLAIQALTKESFDTRIRVEQKNKHTRSSPTKRGTEKRPRKTKETTNERHG